MCLDCTHIYKTFRLISPYTGTIGIIRYGNIYLLNLTSIGFALCEVWRSEKRKKEKRKEKKRRKKKKERQRERKNTTTVNIKINSAVNFATDMKIDNEKCD